MATEQIETPQQPRTSIWPPIPRHVRLRLADAAQVDVRKIERYLLGLPTKGGHAQDRIEKVLAEAGYARA
jgi:hypothetical protein